MIENTLSDLLSESVKSLYNSELPSNLAQVQKTRSEFEGDYTIVVFPLLRMSKKNPEQTANEIGEYLQNASEIVDSFNVVKGFLNLSISDSYWLDFFENNRKSTSFGKEKTKDQQALVIEYSSPNTNKPLHLGHIRNNLLGWSVAEINMAAGRNVKKVNLVNDRGIHICKSMVAWQKWGGGQKPEDKGTKGDKFVGDYYVKFDQEYKKEIASMIEKGADKADAEKNAPVLIEAKQMLKKWEDDDKDVRALWQEMNQWVYNGFDISYKRMGIDFDKVYYESETYLLGKSLVEEGLKNGVLIKKEDGSVWCDLTDEGLDEKLLLRSDGTSVYMTQDLGTAQLRYDDFNPSDLVYVVGNEQIYHFDVLKKVLKKLGRSWADAIHHLSYGMVELPHGKMKSREGTVVDADDLMDAMYDTAKTTSEELAKFDDFTEEESDKLYNILSLGALKYFILKVDPKKTMMFNPEESIDFTGNTGPFIQYTHARIKSVLRKAKEANIDFNLNFDDQELEAKEKSLIKLIYEYPAIIQQAAINYSPAVVANYAYELAKEYNQFYHASPMLKEENENKRALRLAISEFTANTIKSAFALLGIDVPDRM
ncbi:MAG: arginine--tRNA ligase [Marinilabiliales bacterium]|nr:MAG: arginine--tRNA ligase [Marinilabiliales bacterium]